jgi:hypothetical protein
MGDPDGCSTCQHLKEQLEKAREARDRSRVTDYLVLLRRHPRHDDVPFRKRVAS